MTSTIFFVILGSVATILSVFFCALVFGACRRQALSLWEREQRLPEATKYEFLQHRIAEMQQEFDRLRDAVFEAQQILDERDRAQQRLDDLQNELRQRDAEFAELQKVRQELERLQADFADLNQKKLDLDQAILRSEFQAQQLEARLRDLASQVQQAEVAAERLHQLQKDVDLLEKQKRELQQQAESLDQQARKKLNDYNHELGELRQNRDSMKDELRLEQDRLDELKRQREQTEEKLSGLRAEREELDHRLPLLRDDWEKMMTRVGHVADEERTGDLWQPVLPSHNGKLMLEVDESSQLRKLKNHLEESGFRFHPRILYAFHTALKVNDISPLVVLAGISGTGKSELPRRYAEAMGMHFLNIAVQPRWDSPQDMFGFFNYLEGRYRATELGRALVQMDQYFSEPDRGWSPPRGWGENSRSDQVLMVLLDEMNLARVEYYFSEFISRLEMRRGIDLSNAADRGKAEIPLEVGRSGKGGSVMHLFVGQNVLFTGTMNEDETTQSLSDKVVDRANVLRFGPPKKVMVNSGLKEHSSNGNRKGGRRLAYDAWRSWHRDASFLDEDTRTRLHGWIQGLNEAMKMIRRPFAYRVGRAIEAYVANFPRIEGEPWLNWAMSDQIEQKLLPKFRGLDPSEPEIRSALGKVESVVAELEDEPLRQAMQKSRVEHQFLWQGVQRDFDDESGG